MDEQPRLSKLLSHLFKGRIQDGVDENSHDQTAKDILA